MACRFHYLDSTGAEVAIGDLEALRQHVIDGKVDGETVLYDSLTGVWAPATSHAAYTLVADPLTGQDEGEADDTATMEAESAAESREAESEEPEEESESGGAEILPQEQNDVAFPDIEVTLADNVQVESTNEVVERLLKERDRDVDSEIVVEETRARPDGSALDLGQQSEGEAPERDEPAMPDSDPWSRTPHDRPSSPKEEAPRPTARTSGAKKSGRKKQKPPRRGSGRIELSVSRQVASRVAGLGVVAAVVVVGFFVVSRVTAASEALPMSGDAQPLTGTDGSGSPWAGAEGGAFLDMIGGVDSLRDEYDVQRIPEEWLGGPYLAEADDYEHVRDYWENYQLFVDAVRSQDTTLFRRSFVGRLEADDVPGSMISIRLAQAMENFELSQPSRDTVYGRMGDLAASALDLHDLLVERSPEILYEPVTDTTHSRQPILEAWSDNEALRASIWSLLDRITANLALLEMDAVNEDTDLTERLFQELRSRGVSGN